MARWALSPVVGTGTLEDPYRPKVADYATDWQALDLPGDNWMLVRATAGDLAAAEADATITVFPSLAYSDVLTLAQRNWLITRLNDRGLPSGWVEEGITFGQALRTIGRYLQANFELSWIGG